MGTTRPGTGVGVPMSVIRLPAPFGQRNNITPAPVDTMRLTVDNLRLLMTNCGQPATRCGLLPIKCKKKFPGNPSQTGRSGDIPRPGAPLSRRHLGGAEPTATAAPLCRCRLNGSASGPGAECPGDPPRRALHQGCSSGGITGVGSWAAAPPPAHAGASGSCAAPVPLFRNSTSCAAISILAPGSPFCRIHP